MVAPPQRSIPNNPSPNGHREKYGWHETFTAAELTSWELPEARWAVPGILPEGVSLLVGKPKLGKSWLALGLCVATASGGAALGKIHVEQGSRRLQGSRAEGGCSPGRYDGAYWWAVT